MKPLFWARIPLLQHIYIYGPHPFFCPEKSKDLTGTAEIRIFGPKKMIDFYPFFGSSGIARPKQGNQTPILSRFCLKNAPNPRFKKIFCKLSRCIWTIRRSIDQNINKTWVLCTFCGKCEPNAGFVNVVHVVLLKVFKNVLKTRVLLMLLMLLIFLGSIRNRL